jgi:N-sulfoglucosamine sulfohydrolase
LDTYNTANQRYWEYSFGKKPEEEFFTRTSDRFCVENLAKDNSVIEEKEYLKQKMLHLLREQQDPRVLGNDSIFDKYPIMKSQRNFYNRYMVGEKLQWGWVNASDFRPFQNEDAIY